MAPLGIGNGSNADTSMASQDQLSALLHEIQKLEASKSDLKENMKTLHKYILTIFCLYCRHLWMEHKQQRINISTTMNHFKAMIRERVKKLTQLTFQMGSSFIMPLLKKIKFLQLYFTMYSAQIHHKSHKSFFRKIIAVYYVFDRLVHKLDDKIKEKLDKINTEILSLQQRYEIQSKSDAIQSQQQQQQQNNNVKQESDTSSVYSINNRVKDLKMDIDGDSDNENIHNNNNISNKNNINGISDAEVRTLHQLIDQSGPKNAALRTLADLLPQNTAVAVPNLSGNVILIQPAQIITPTTLNTVSVGIQPILVQSVANTAAGRPVIILNQNATEIARSVPTGPYHNGNTTQAYYQPVYSNNNNNNYSGYTTSTNTYQTSSNSYNNNSCGNGYVPIFTNGGNDGNGGNNNTFGFHSQHMYDPYNNNNNDNNKKQQQKQQMHNDCDQNEFNQHVKQNDIMNGNNMNQNMNEHGMIHHNNMNQNYAMVNQDNMSNMNQNNCGIMNGSMNQNMMNQQNMNQQNMSRQNMNQNCGMNNNNNNNNNNMNNQQNNCNIFSSLFRTKPVHNNEQNGNYQNEHKYICISSNNNSNNNMYYSRPPPPPIPNIINHNNNNNIQQNGMNGMNHCVSSVPTIPSIVNMRNATFQINHNTQSNICFNNNNNNIHIKSDNFNENHCTFTSPQCTNNLCTVNHSNNNNNNCNNCNNCNAFTNNTPRINNFYIPVIASPANIINNTYNNTNTNTNNNNTYGNQTDSCPSFTSHNYKLQLKPANNNNNNNNNNKCIDYSSSCSLTSSSNNETNPYDITTIKQSPPSSQPLYLSPLSSNNASPLIDLQSNCDSVYYTHVNNYKFDNKSISNGNHTDTSDTGTITPPSLSGLPIPAHTASKANSSPPNLSTISNISNTSHLSANIIKFKTDNNIIRGDDDDPTSQRTSAGKLKRFQCNICNAYWFETTSALQMHVNTHIIMQRTTKKQSDDPNRPWQCELCQRKFAEKCTLKRHVRIHTNEKPWKCQYCNKAFNQSCSLQAHIRIHTGERPFPCVYCEKRFRQSTHRRQHMKRVHKQQWESGQALNNKAKKKKKIKKKSKGKK